MVICDVDHPDIEEFINWKVIEEQKVAALVAGSKLHEKMLNKIFEAVDSEEVEKKKQNKPKDKQRTKQSHQRGTPKYDPRYIHQ